MADKIYSDTFSVFTCCIKAITAWKVSKYRVFSGTYFPVFELNTGKYGPEKTPFLDTFHAVYLAGNGLIILQKNEVYNTYDKWSIPLRIYSVIFTKSSGNWGFGLIYWRNP